VVYPSASPPAVRPPAASGDTPRVAPEKGRTEIRTSINNSARQSRPCPGPRISEQVGEHTTETVGSEMRPILNRPLRKIVKLPIDDYAIRPD